MRILNQNDVEIDLTSIDYEKGYLIEDRLFIAHHDANDFIEEQGHWIVIAECLETGGKEVKWIVDEPAIPAREAWDEYEYIQRYILYTEEELAAREAEKETENNRANRINQLINSGALKEDLQELYEALDMILNGVTE